MTISLSSVISYSKSWVLGCFYVTWIYLHNIPLCLSPLWSVLSPHWKSVWVLIHLDVKHLFTQSNSACLNITCSVLQGSVLGPSCLLCVLMTWVPFIDVTGITEHAIFRSLWRSVCVSDKSFDYSFKSFVRKSFERLLALVWWNFFFILVFSGLHWNV